MHNLTSYGILQVIKVLKPNVSLDKVDYVSKGGLNIFYDGPYKRLSGSAVALL